MKISFKKQFLLTSAIMAMLSGQVEAGVIAQGAPLPGFNLPTIQGGAVTQQKLTQGSLGVLYFFSKNNCPSCMSGLAQLQSLSSEHKLAVVAVGKQPLAELKTGISPMGFRFPIAAGDEATLSRFGAQYVFPTTYLIGPQAKVAKVIQGGGVSAEKIILSIAEKQVQQRQMASARQLYEKVAAVQTARTVTTAPGKATPPKATSSGPTEKQLQGLARAGIGYSFLKEGKVTEAEQIFKQLAQDDDKKNKIRGKEGLAKVLLQKGQTDLALKEVNDVIAVEPKRSAAHVVKATVLAQKGDRQMARTALAQAKAADADEDFSWDKAEAYFAEGNLAKQEKNSKIALASFEKAAQEDPFMTEALSNKGVLLQELGEPDKALETFQQLKSVNPNDKLVASFLRQAQAALAQKQDLEKQKYIDSLVKDLVAQFNAQKSQAKTNQDEWTSPALAISLLGFQQPSQNNDIMQRIGVDGVLQEEITQELQKLGVKVVDRAILDKLLAELKLGSSALADPDTQLKLGRIMASRLILTGQLFNTGRNNLATIRVIDTETTGIVLSSASRQSNRLLEMMDFDPAQIAKKFAQEIQKTIQEKYPLKGRLALVDGETIVINLGKKHGVQEGQHFNVLGESTPIELNGRVLGHRDAKLGELEITKVEDLLAYAKPVNRTGQWDKNQRVILKN